MKSCPYCREDLHEDAMYCTHCGKPIEEIKVVKKDTKISKKQRVKMQQEQQVVPKNMWVSLGVILFLVALVGFDGVLAMVVNAMDADYQFVFILSTLLYIGAVGCGIMAIIKDYQTKKKGDPINSSYSMAIAEIVISSYIILVNVQQILLG